MFRGRPWQNGVAIAAAVLATVMGDGALAQGGGGTTFTTSITSSSSTESPPACATVGSTRTVTTVGTPTVTVGPSCIGIGDRNVANAAPACGAFPPAPPPVDPFHGTAFIVDPGNINLNVNTNFETITCLAASSAASVPATSPIALGALALMLGIAAMALLYRRRVGRS